MALLMGALSSCAHPPKEAESASASGTEYYETMLEERLGYTPENTVLGIGSSAEYGIDMTDFENDGYIIRTMGDNTVIFGKAIAYEELGYTSGGKVEYMNAAKCVFRRVCELKYGKADTWENDPFLPDPVPHKAAQDGGEEA